MHQTLDKIIIRLPDGMRSEIQRRAKANRRSMNAEIVIYLEDALERSESIGAEKVAASPAPSVTVSPERIKNEPSTN